MHEYLIAGLGNPGRAYLKTRHNIGIRAVTALAMKHKLEFQDQLKWKGRLAEGKIGSASVVLMMPFAFMNRSGEVLAPVFRFWGIELSRLLVIVDDIAIPMGQLRMRANSGSGGHNGLKSIETCLQTNGFTRLRIGVGDRREGDLTSHVLGRFSLEEEQLIPQILERAVVAIEIWLEKGLNHAMDFANRPSNPSRNE